MDPIGVNREEAVYLVRIDRLSGFRVCSLRVAPQSGAKREAHDERAPPALMESRRVSRGVDTVSPAPRA